MSKSNVVFCWDEAQLMDLSQVVGWYSDAVVRVEQIPWTWAQQKQLRQ